MVKFFLLLALGLLVGCGTTPVLKLPSTMEGAPPKFRVVLETRSQIVAIQKLAAHAKCEKVKNELKVIVKSDSSGDKIAVEPACEAVPRSLVVQSKEYLPKGEYTVSVESNDDKMKFAQPPVVTANPQDPEAMSGPDQDFGGAVELGENQTVKGAVNFAGANATNWVQVKGKGGDIALFFLGDGTNDVTAKLYQMPKGAKAPRRLGALPVKTKKHVRAADGVVLVQISGKKYAGEVPYTLTRRDTAGVKSIVVPVIDCYPINASASVVLLKPSEALKVNDELQISAKGPGGESAALGKCTVTSVSESQASCRLEAVPPQDAHHYRAELVKEEGNS